MKFVDPFSIFVTLILLFFRKSLKQNCLRSVFVFFNTVKILFIFAQNFCERNYFFWDFFRTTKIFHVLHVGVGLSARVAQKFDLGINFF